MANKPKFKVGSKVKLNSGGPKMSVSSVDRGDDAIHYWCQWFAGKKLERGRFPEDSLDEVTEADK